MVSIIIPAYNYATLISMTLDSVLAQTYPAFECIIVDNGSTDNTLEVVTPYLSDSRFKYIRQENKGVSGARITGLKVAEGEYVLFLDADDLIEKDKLKTAVEVLDANLDIAIAYSDMRYFKTGDPGTLFRNYQCNKNYDAPWMSYLSGSGAEVAAVFVKGNNMVISSPVFRRNVISEIGLPDPSLNYNEDWDFWLRMVLAGKKIKYVEEQDALTLVRVHSYSASRNVFGMQVAGLRVLEKNAQKIRDLGLSQLLSQRIMDHEKAIALSLLQCPSRIFKERMSYLKQHGLSGRIFKREMKNPYFAKIYLGLKYLIS